MIDPNKRIKDAALDALSRKNDPSACVTIIELLVCAILNDFAEELADLVVGHIVRTGGDVAVAKDIAKLIIGRKDRFNIG